jgi:hypothetical protein
MKGGCSPQNAPFVEHAEGDFKRILKYFSRSCSATGLVPRDLLDLSDDPIEFVNQRAPSMLVKAIDHGAVIPERALLTRLEAPPNGVALFAQIMQDGSRIVQLVGR